VIVVFGNDKAWRLSQVAAWDSEPMKRTISRLKPKLRKAIVSLLNMTFPPVG
jgi:hypothetical protein